MTNWKWPRGVKTRLVEANARTYSDPVQKLAYLRKFARSECDARLRRGRTVSRKWSMAFLFVLFLGFRMQSASDASVGLALVSQTPSAPIGSERALGHAAWCIERGQDYEIYSNGLRIETRFAVPTTPRAYTVFDPRSGARRLARLRTEPVGIVLHTTESRQAPFAAEHNTALRHIGRELLEYTARHRAYNYVIDRFGRVFRIVPETDEANHAGKSVWADADGVYVNLNRSFLGVSFEAATRALDDGVYLSPAQINSGKLLIELLTSKYKIALTNCITHAQVSVNPDNMKIGYHTDGSGDFPFESLGLPDNASLPLPGVFVYGFGYDPGFLKTSGPRLWKGLLGADERLRHDAVSCGMSASQYRKTLQQKYRTIAAMVNVAGALKEKENEISE